MLCAAIFFSVTGWVVDKCCTNEFMVVSILLRDFAAYEVNMPASTNVNCWSCSFTYIVEVVSTEICFGCQHVNVVIRAAWYYLVSNTGKPVIMAALPTLCILDTAQKLMHMGLSMAAIRGICAFNVIHN